MISIIVAIVGLYVAIVAAAYVRQRSMMYFPDKQRVTPAVVELAGVEEITFPSGDGVRLLGWYRQAEPGEPTVLYFSGNAGSAAWRAERMKYIAAKGYGFLFLNYRGYGGSAGDPHEEGLIADGTCRLSATGAAPHSDGRDHSVRRIPRRGGGGAGRSTRPSARPRRSSWKRRSQVHRAVDVAAKTYPYLPARWLMKDRFESINHIKFIDASLLIIHGETDQVVPFSLGQRLFEEALEPKSFFAVPDVGHNELDVPEVRARVEQFIDELTD